MIECVRSECDRVFRQHDRGAPTVRASPPFSHLGWACAWRVSPRHARYDKTLFAVILRAMVDLGQRFSAAFNTDKPGFRLLSRVPSTRGSDPFEGAPCLPPAYLCRFLALHGDISPPVGEEPHRMTGARFDLRAVLLPAACHRVGSVERTACMPTPTPFGLACRCMSVSLMICARLTCGRAERRA